MAGLPLTSGFIAKFGVFADAWASGARWLVVVAVVASVVSFAAYLRVIVAMYMSETEAPTLDVRGLAKLVVTVSVVVTLLVGILPGTLLQYAANALPL
jgi:NADH-quinone oxidoreductase subunit N